MGVNQLDFCTFVFNFRLGQRNMPPPLQDYTCTSDPFFLSLLGVSPCYFLFPLSLLVPTHKYNFLPSFELIYEVLSPVSP